MATPTTTEAAPPLLAVEDFSVSYATRAGAVPAVTGVTLEIGPGESLGLVGESGCGKSTLAYGVMHHLGPSARITNGRVRFAGQDLAGLSAAEIRAVRARDLAMVFQEPGASLNPVLTIGRQLMETPRVLEGLDRAEARGRALDLLAEVRLPDPEAMLGRYPHQLSGGQQQRVVIAMALIRRPRLLVMDEPTTGLDATVEASILELVNELRARRGMALLFISHNLGTVLRVCERVGVMYCGELVEEGPAREVFSHPRHPYTQGLLACLPRLGAARGTIDLRPIPGSVPNPLERPTGCTFAPRCEFALAERCSRGPIAMENLAGDGHRVRCVRHGEISPGAAQQAVRGAAVPPAGERLLGVAELSKAYGREGVSWLPGTGRGPRVRALTEVSLSLSQGETLALVGESGCGKTTLGKILSGLEEASAGSAAVEGTEVAQVAVERRPLALRRAIQMVFQDPEAAFNPSHSIGFTLRRALRRLGSGRAVGEEVDRLLTAVGLSPAFASRLPRNLSGGEKQRAALARALAGQPRLLIADEPVSALDVSVQAAILNLLQEIQGAGGMALLFISHDLAVVRHLADRVAVMYLGRIVESGPAERVFAPPYHPYTEALLSAALTPDPDAVGTRILLEGPPPSALEIPAGCPFHPRCPRKIGPLCENEPPPEVAAGAGHTLRCHIPLEELRKVGAVIGEKRA